MTMTNREVLDAAFAAIGDADLARMDELYADDVVLEFPFGSGARVEGWTNVRPYLEGAFQRFRFTLTITEVYETTDPDLLIAEYTSDGQVLPEGTPYANRYVGFWWFRDGRVCGTREYLDPTRVPVTG